MNNATNTELFSEIGRLNIRLNERDKEIERLKGLMPPDERGPGFVGQGSWSVFAEKVVEERDALREELAAKDKEIERLRGERPDVVAWLRRMERNAIHWSGKQDNERADIYHRLADVFECGEHRKETE